jgi:hypothetical protein
MKRKKGLLDELREEIGYDEGSDIPVHERFAEEGTIKRLPSRRRKIE